MYYNKAICDVYVGTGAGRKLMEELQNAKRSVKVMSPYMSAALVRKLIDLHHRDIDVQLITMDDIADFYGDWQRNIHQLIIQDIFIDEEAKALRSKLILRKRLLYILLWTMIAVLFVMAFKLQDRMVLWTGIPLLLLWFLIRNYSKRIKNTTIYLYSYRQLFPFRVFLTPESNSYSHPFIHGKLYLIDDEIAYLGSLNFTANGTRNNYETRIRITDKKAVKELLGEFESLFHNPDYPERDLAEWGRELYGEAGN
ncbi:hypothetical protein EHW67_09385 [Arenibacter aquaticus]|uniref:phospholipase D n=1 Tax=Arenibacter aquaticus TaxID=2489054 RepID=A0A3S0BXU0_9FLAO|nr:phospholipase D family protein [Arenibacter aquaticus]RTE54125.1 hypothetical protein EHW67_09385 [Arenibacter aquaticus]